MISKYEDKLILIRQLLIYTLTNFEGKIIDILICSGFIAIFAKGIKIILPKIKFQGIVLYNY